MRFTPIERAGNLEIDEQLPDSDLGREVAEDIRSGKRSGLSVEFHATEDRMVQGVREISGALVNGAAVDSRAGVPAGACRGSGEYQASAGADVAVGSAGPVPGVLLHELRGERLHGPRSSGTTSRVRRRPASGALLPQECRLPRARSGGRWQRQPWRATAERSTRTSWRASALTWCARADSLACCALTRPAACG